MEVRAGAIAAVYIDSVFESPGVSEIIIAQDAIASRRNAVDAVQALRSGRSGVGGEGAILDDEGTAIEGNVFNDGCGRPGAVVDKDNGAVDVELGVVSVAGGRTAAGVKIDVSEA